MVGSADPGKPWRRITALAACLGIASACGGLVDRSGLDDPDAGGFAGGPVPAGGASSFGGTSGIGGAISGASGAGGSSGTAGAGSTGGSVGQVCGKALCFDFDARFQIGKLSSCCPDTSSDRPEDSVCGVVTDKLEVFGFDIQPRCQALKQPGVSDSTCPALRVQGGGANTVLLGCCTELGTCGYELNWAGGVEVGLGCVAAVALDYTHAPRVCGPRAVRPHHFSCSCTNGSTHEFCLARGCEASLEHGNLCTHVCGGADNRRGYSCDDDSPICLP
jgi:hypothetical protein